MPELDDAVARDACRDVTDQLDPRCRELVADHVAGRRAERRERLGLGRHKRHRELATDRPPGPRPRSGATGRPEEERELVGGERPLAVRRHDHHDRVHAARAAVAEHRVDRLAVAGVVEQDAVIERRIGHRPDREHEDVVRHDGARPQPDLAPGAIDRRDRVATPAGIQRPRDVRQRVPACRLVPERLEDAERAQRERVVRGDQRGRDLMRGEPADGDERLEAGDAGPGDEDAERPLIQVVERCHRASVADRGRAAIRASPRRGSVVRTASMRGRPDPVCVSGSKVCGRTEIRTRAADRIGGFRGRRRARAARA